MGKSLSKIGSGAAKSADDVSSGATIFKGLGKERQDDIFKTFQHNYLGNDVSITAAASPQRIRGVKEVLDKFSGDEKIGAAYALVASGKASKADIKEAIKNLDAASQDAILKGMKDLSPSKVKEWAGKVGSALTGPALAAFFVVTYALDKAGVGGGGGDSSSSDSSASDPGALLSSVPWYVWLAVAVLSAFMCCCCVCLVLVMATSGGKKSNSSFNY